MSEIDGGGFAFPVAEDAAMFPGLTKREWFAGMALQGLLANPSIIQKGQDLTGISFDYADAMIRAGKGEK